MKEQILDEYNIKKQMLFGIKTATVPQAKKDGISTEEFFEKAWN